MNALVIANTTIRQDAEGRYCLNDLHQAAVSSGANERTKEPGKFMASPQTVELVGELETTQNPGSLPVSTVKGRGGGTFVCKELVYAYAMWISPAFSLKVIRAYDAMVVSQSTAHKVPSTLSEALLLAGKIEAEKERLAAQLVEAAPKIEFFDATVKTEDTLSFNEAAKVLGVGPRELLSVLRNRGVFCTAKSLKNRNIPLQDYIDRKYFAVTYHDFVYPSGQPGRMPSARITGKGLQWIQRTFFQIEACQLKLHFNPNQFGEYKNGASTDVVLKLLNDYRRPMDRDEITQKTGLTRGQRDWAIRTLKRDKRVKVTVHHDDTSRTKNGYAKREMYEVVLS